MHIHDRQTRTHTRAIDTHIHTCHTSGAQLCMHTFVHAHVHTLHACEHACIHMRVHCIYARGVDTYAMCVCVCTYVRCVMHVL